jgi:hypothetical protein
MLEEIQQEGNYSAKEILQTVMNLLMQSERNVHVHIPTQPGHQFQ